MRALITGGAGFIGSYLAEALLDKGWKVSIIDDLSTGSIKNIEHLKPNPNLDYTIDTIMNIPLMAELVDRADCIFHLAATVGVRLIVESPVRTIETNIKGTEIILELAAKKKKKILITSSSEVYGKSNKVPFREDDDIVLGPTIRARWSYACSKAIDEFLALAYYRERKLPVIICRLFNTVGPRQTGAYGMVIPRLVRQALKNEPITVYGDGSQTRTFTDVHEVVWALRHAVLETGAEGEVFNIGGTEEISILNLAKMVKSLTESDSEIKFIPFDEAYDKNFEDMGRRAPDIEKARRIIGFNPQCRMEDILRKIIHHIKNNS
ncbi:MAG TPA: GDP-mannose 4,6-dehydratase [Candidatus Sumerlaeota bacterium]|nr:MAG: Bifunctional polymyxin resistance protein ArnA [candidate division BRC1 bacterium ADurb.Bin183]HOE62707.1 GDP-mannose 4,6-dehydratase [Candidatus Sumerlaeota bacterium]HRR31202.1 GDP-mannose 4,6-dehydratase [Candidatus Sumerlaeia bacterium]HON50433.1 GDP-mannose 4,6-dehydratase [Candidatus Sumerlaeota bacterium]HOR63649.1 GDP-mannose 4,6-dehydratase [Candidatus Sumerlaeota bacterium]